MLRRCCNRLRLLPSAGWSESGNSNRLRRSGGAQRRGSRPGAWDYLGDGQPFTSFRWYRFAEAALSSDQPIYVVLSRQGEPLARATFWLKRREYLPVTSKIAYHLLQMLLRVRPLLACRSPLSSLSGLILPPPPLRDAAIAALATTAQEIARQRGVSFTLFDYLETSEQESAGWPDAYAVFKFSNPGTRLDINWPDFESYLGYLGKSVRKDYHRHCNRAADQGIVVEVSGQVTEIDRAMALIHNVEQHHGSFPNPDAQRVLETAHLADASWLTARIDGELVGCGLLLGDRGGKVLALLGLNYDIKYVYFQLVYAAIRHAIESGTRVLRGGGGAYEMKERLGFTVETQNYVVFTTGSPLLRRLVRRLPVA